MIISKCYRKLFACDINKSVARERTRNFIHFTFQGKPIIRVEIAGIIVSIIRREGRITLHVDDGTDVVRCMKNFFDDEEFGHFDTVSIGMRIDYEAVV